MSQPMKRTLPLLLVAAGLLTSACAVNGTYVVDPALPVPVYIGPAPLPVTTGERFSGTAGWRSDVTDADDTSITTTTTEHNYLASSIAKNVNANGGFATECRFTMEGDFGNELVTLWCDAATLTGGAK